MSDKKISDLVELTSLAADDVLPVVDASANATKRVTYDTLATEVRTEAEPLSATTVTATTVTASGNASVDGTLSFDSGFGSTGVSYGVRAWAEIDGAGNISESGNIDSVTKLQTGDYNISIENDMPDANYAVCVQDGSGCNEITYRRRGKNNGSYRIQTLCASARFDTTFTIMIVR